MILLMITQSEPQFDCIECVLFRLFAHTSTALCVVSCHGNTTFEQVTMQYYLSRVRPTYLCHGIYGNSYERQLFKNLFRLTTAQQ